MTTNELLIWMKGRLVEVHGEHPNCDYMLKFDKAIREHAYLQERNVELFAENQGIKRAANDQANINDLRNQLAEARQMDFADALRDTDYFTHHNDWFSACKIAYINADNEADSSYWMHQLNTLSALEAEYGNPAGVKNK